MSRDIDFTEPLSGDDAQYVLDRPWLLQDQELAGNTVRFADDDFELEGDDTDADETGDEEEDEGVDYTKLTIIDLKAEIERRNGEKGEDEEEIDPASDRKGDLIAALVADDEATDEDAE